MVNTSFRVLYFIFNIAVQVIALARVLSSRHIIVVGRVLLEDLSKYEVKGKEQFPSTWILIVDGCRLSFTCHLSLYRSA